MLVEPVSDFVFAKIPQKCYQARKCTTVACNTQFHKTGFLIKLIVRTCSFNYGILAAFKILNIGIHILCCHIFSF